jgi:hypothetical protein
LAGEKMGRLRVKLLYEELFFLKMTFDFLAHNFPPLKENSWN